MKRAFACGVGIGALVVFAGCASFAPDLPSGEEQQLDHPATLSGTPAGPNPLDVPDEATLPHVPGQ